jgi:hypothetical protein
MLSIFLYLLVRFLSLLIFFDLSVQYFISPIQYMEIYWLFCYKYFTACTYIFSYGFCHFRFSLIYLYNISSYQYNMWKYIGFFAISILLHVPTYFRIYNMFSTKNIPYFQNTVEVIICEDWEIAKVPLHMMLRQFCATLWPLPFLRYFSWVCLRIDSVSSKLIQ